MLDLTRGLLDGQGNTQTLVDEWQSTRTFGPKKLSAQRLADAIRVATTDSWMQPC